MIKAIVFDFGSVLDVPVDWDAWYAQREALAQRFGMTGQALWFTIFHSEHWQQAKRGQITEAEMWEAILIPLGLETAEARDAFTTALFAGRGINPDMRALVDRLRGRYTLAVLSNASVREMDRWLADKFGLDGFDDVISSADVGLAKPDAAIYALLLERINCAAAETLFIDDLTRNTTAAEALGIQTIVFTSPQALTAELAARGILEETA